MPDKHQLYKGTGSRGIGGASGGMSASTPAGPSSSSPDILTPTPSSVSISKFLGLACCSNRFIATALPQPWQQSVRVITEPSDKSWENRYGKVLCQRRQYGSHSRSSRPASILTRSLRPHPLVRPTRPKKPFPRAPIPLSNHQKGRQALVSTAVCDGIRDRSGL